MEQRIGMISISSFGADSVSSNKHFHKKNVDGLKQNIAFLKYQGVICFYLLNSKYLVI